MIAKAPYSASAAASRAACAPFVLESTNLELWFVLSRTINVVVEP